MSPLKSYINFIGNSEKFWIFARIMVFKKEPDRIVLPLLMTCNTFVLDIVMSSVFVRRQSRFPI